MHAHPHPIKDTPALHKCSIRNISVECTLHGRYKTGVVTTFGIDMERVTALFFHIIVYNNL